jgi:hypothetical protein
LLRTIRAAKSEKSPRANRKAGGGNLRPFFCQPHRERAGIEVPASRIIFGTPMCSACSEGKLLFPKPVGERSDSAKAFGYMRNVAPVLPGTPLRHKVNKASWAIALARIHPQNGLGGTGNLDSGWLRARGKFNRDYLRMARAVLRHTPELADQVSSGAMTLTRAYRIVQARNLPQNGGFNFYTHVKGRRLGRKGRQAIELAKVFPWRGRGGDGEALRACEAEGLCRKFLSQARGILRHSPQLAEAVLRGDIGLNLACKIVRREKQESRRLRMLQSAGRFQTPPYLRPRTV